MIACARADVQPLTHSPPWWPAWARKHAVDAILECPCEYQVSSIGAQAAARVVLSADLLDPPRRQRRRSRTSQPAGVVSGDAHYVVNYEQQTFAASTVPGSAEGAHGLA